MWGGGCGHFDNPVTQSILLDALCGDYQTSSKSDLEDEGCFNVFPLVECLFNASSKPGNC